MTTQKEADRAEAQAKTQLENITEMVKALDTKDDTEREAAEQTIHDDILSIQVRSDWHTPGEEATDTEYELLLCTGGPAVRIVGELDEHGQPDSARLEYQDWGTPWTEYRMDSTEEATVITYANQFYYRA